jgi:hypothetical protein
MPVVTATPGRVFVLCLSGLVTLWLLGFFPTSAMDSIPSTFTIEIDGKPLARIDQGADDGTQAKLGKDAAVFSLKNSRLQCGDWIMGRNLRENRSYGPKKVAWYKANSENEKQVQLVTAKKEGEAYHLMFTSTFLLSIRAKTDMYVWMLKLRIDAKLMLDGNDTVLADLLGGEYTC